MRGRGLCFPARSTLERPIMHDLTRTGAVQIFAHAANAAFAERLAAALDAAGYRIVNGAFDPAAVDAVLVVWSGAAMGSERLLAAAAAPLARDMLVPLSIGRVEPPQGFRHLEPVDLGGWSGDRGDPRWRRVLEAIEDAACALRGPASAPPAAETAGTAGAHAAPPALPPPPRFAVPSPGAMVSGLLAAAARAAGAGLRLVVAAAVALFAGAVIAVAVAVRAMRRVAGMANLARAPLAAGTAVAGALLLAGFLLLTPNAPPPGAPLAAAVAEDVAEDSEPAPVVIASLEAADLPPAEELALAVAAPSEPSETPPTAAAALAGASESLFGPEELDAIVGEGDADFDAAPAETPPAPTPGEGGDRIAALIASSVGADTPPAPPADPAPAVSQGAFRDCGDCPEMAILPPGRFKMGSPAGEPTRQPFEGPQIDVTIPRSIAIGAKEVTFAEWDACVAAGGCGAHVPDDAGWGRGARPVINVSWDDANAYAAWLSQKTGLAYRLPSEAEWEYAARAGGAAPFHTGASIAPAQANFDGRYPYMGEAGEVRGRTVPAGGFPANAFGLHDLHGNVWEWVADCWAESHDGAPEEGAPRGGACGRRVIKGGAWNTGAWRLRAGHRLGKPEAERSFAIGFRVARDVE